MNYMAVILSVATVLMTSSGVYGDGDCFANDGDQLVTTVKLSQAPEWYVQSTNEHAMTCTKFTVDSSITNINDGYLNFFSIKPNGQENMATRVLKYVSTGHYNLWYPQDLNNTSGQPYGNATFIYYDATSFTLVTCLPSDITYYFTATTARDVSNATIDNLESYVTSVTGIDVTQNHYYVQTPNCAQLSTAAPPTTTTG